MAGMKDPIGIHSMVEGNRDEGAEEAPDATKNEAPFGLTPREFEVAKMIAWGNDPREIAKALGISIKTYDTHRLHILAKSKCKNTVRLTRELIRLGVVEMPS